MTDEGTLMNTSPQREHRISALKRAVMSAVLLTLFLAAFTSMAWPFAAALVVVTGATTYFGFAASAST